MKKNVEMKHNVHWGKILLILTLSIALCATFCFGSTLAKYFTQSSGTATSGSVAKWDWKINDTTASSTFTFNLFGTINDTVDGNNETDVATGKLAPGTQGSFVIEIDNASDVSGLYAIDFTATLSGIPLTFSTDGENYGTIDSIDISDTAIAMTSGTDSVTVYWQWAFDGVDATDTALGTTGTAVATVTATATFTQVD